MASKTKLLLVDGNSVAFRAFFALYNQLDRFTNQDGLHTNAIYAFNNMLEIVLKAVQPDAALVAFDAGKTTFRTAKYADYKVVAPRHRANCWNNCLISRNCWMTWASRIMN